MKKNLYFSKTCLLMDVLIQPGKDVSIQLGTLSSQGTVVYTESGAEPEFLDSDFYGEGKFLMDFKINKDIILNIIKNSSSNKEVYIEIIKTINKRN